jgi:spoIIIJ-associated protein
VREVTAQGNTIEQAVDNALQQLSTTKDEVDIVIVEEAKKGFLGLFGAKPAIVTVIRKQTVAEKTINYLSNIVKALDESAQIEVKETDKSLYFTIKGDKVALIIGKRGATLNSIQFLTQTFINRHSKPLIHIVVDAENYRQKRKESLEILAAKVSKTVERTKKAVSLEPMPSFERKIVHNALTKAPNITTKSVGEDPYRQLVVSFKSTN